MAGAAAARCCSRRFTTGDAIVLTPARGSEALQIELRGNLAAMLGRQTSSVIHCLAVAFKCPGGNAPDSTIRWSAPKRSHAHPVWCGLTGRSLGPDTRRSDRRFYGDDVAYQGFPPSCRRCAALTRAVRSRWLGIYRSVRARVVRGIHGPNPA